METNILVRDSENESHIIYLYPHQIVINNHNYVSYGRIFLKVRSKKIFTKWSERIFFLTKKRISFWKMKKKKRVKRNILFFDNFFGISGLSKIFDKEGVDCYEFNLLKNKFNSKTKKKFTFRAYNIDFCSIYEIIENIQKRNFFNKYKD